MKGTGVIDVRQCGKSQGLDEPYPLVAHLIDSAMVCGAVWDSVLTAGQRGRIARELGIDLPEAKRTVMFWTGLHDVGKIMPQFQDMILKKRPTHCGFLSEAQYEHDRRRDSQVRPVRHENATHAALPQLLAHVGYPSSGGRLGKLLLVQVAQILGGHHGRYPVDNDPGDLRDPLARVRELGSGAWSGQRREHVKALHDVLGRPVAPVCRALPAPLAVVIAGVVILSDWLASQEHVIEAQQKALALRGDFDSPASLRAHAREAERMAPGLVADAGLGPATLRTGGFGDLFPDIETPHPLQSSVARSLADARLEGPGILLVTAPTGEGKTETALYAASVMGSACGNTGIFFALPTQATANQMYGRLVDFAELNLLESAQLTLLHGSADLHGPYSGVAPGSSGQAAEPRVISDDEPDTARGARVSVEAGRWPRENGRGVLAPLAVGTIDQALMAVLPLKRNALRQLGLSGKTVVIDEAHAYDAYTHELLLRLLEWLGAMGVPVVLLSATLTGDIARGMVKSYLAGADPSAGSREVPAPSYPGWLYASAHDQRVIQPAEALSSPGSRELTVDVRHVIHSYEPERAGSRLATVLEVLDDVATGGGCAAVVCTTVGEAQRTYLALREYYGSRYGDGYRGWDDLVPDDDAGQDATAGPRLRLLHSRFSGRRRAEITAEAESWFGRGDKPGVKRPAGPRGAILVATQVIEQSLDLDFDLVVSDLAPMAMLLQRAGRVWRHLDPAPTRPAWSAAPRLVVLAPVSNDRQLAVPQSWGEVYHQSLLQRTLKLLDRRGGAPIRVPQDVQALVNEVYEEEFASVAPEELVDRDIERLADDMARRAMANLVALPRPHVVSSLHPLTASDADEDLVRTRLGAEPVQVLPVFENTSGRWLDEECTVALPEFGRRRDRRFTRAEVRTLLSYVAPLPSGVWREACGPANEPPAAWSKEPRLARIVLLPQRVTDSGPVGAVLGEYQITYDRVVGLATRRPI